MALDDDGQILCYLTLKQPAGLGPDSEWTFRDGERPLFPSEEIHGRRWQGRITGVDEIAAASCWELARFVKDQRRSADAITMRAPLEIALGVARLARHPTYHGMRLVIGDLDPEVALRNVRFFYVPVATWNAAQRARIRWKAVVLGPGEQLPRDRISWIIEGYAQALTYSATGLSHLAGLGSDVAFVPQEDIMGSLATIEAATPLRLL